MLNNAIVDMKPEALEAMCQTIIDIGEKLSTGTFPLPTDGEFCCIRASETNNKIHSINCKKKKENENVQ